VNRPISPCWVPLTETEHVKCWRWCYTLPFSDHLNPIGRGPRKADARHHGGRRRRQLLEPRSSASSHRSSSRSASASYRRQDVAALRQHLPPWRCRRAPWRRNPSPSLLYSLPPPFPSQAGDIRGKLQASGELLRRGKLPASPVESSWTMARSASHRRFPGLISKMRHFSVHVLLISNHCSCLLFYFIGIISAAE
jgi:hypothetical protein